MNPVARAIDCLSEPSPAVRWLMQAGPIAEKLNRDAKLDVFRSQDIPPSPRRPATAQEAAGDNHGD